MRVHISMVDLVNSSTQQELTMLQTMCARRLADLRNITLTDEEKAIGSKISTIIALRSRTGIGVEQAKEIVDKFYYAE